MRLFDTFFNSHTFILLIISLQFVSPYHWDGNTMYDLESVTKFGFEQEAYSWACSNALTTTGVISSKCGSDYIIGGYNIVAGSGAAYSGHNFYKSYYSLPAHNQIKLSIKIFPVDSWDLATNDGFSIVIDGTTIGGWVVTYTSPYATTSVCGNTLYNEYPAFTAYVTFPHTNTNVVTLRIYGYFNEDSTNESLGFRDITMTFETVASPATTICGINTVPLPDKACACPDPHQYQNPTTSGTCSGCHVSCNTCNGGLANNCQSCFPQFYYSGGQCLPCSSPCSECSGGALNQCTSCIAGYFLVGNTCYPTCEFPLTSTISGAVVTCNTPCTGSFAMWDGSCSAVCDPPFDPQTINTFSVCLFPCDPSEYLYWNTSCKATCPGPLRDSIILGRKYCDYQCGSTQWLYWDSSCQNSCDFPLSQRIEGPTPLQNFCDYPCQPEEFMYWNGSCKASCPGALTKRVEGSPARNYCDYVCTGSDFLYWDGSCQGSCDFPLSQRIEGDTTTDNFCDYPCQPDEFLYWNGTCLESCNLPLEKRIEGTPERQYCDFPCATTTDYLYTNQNCSSDCPYPFSSLAEGSPMIRKYCYFPCENVEFWSWWASTCIESCGSPLIKESWDVFSFCHLPCLASEPFYMMDTGKCEEKCEFPSTPDYEKPYVRCFPPKPDPFKDIPSGSLVVASVEKGTVSIVTLVKQMQYVRYLDIEMPLRLVRIGVSFSRSFVSIRSDIDLWDSAREDFAKAEPPMIFASHYLSGGFLVNYWGNLTLELIIGFAAVMLTVLTFMCRRFGLEFWEIFFERLRVIVACNLLIMILATNIDDLILHVALQIKTLSLQTSAAISTASFILCMLFMVLGGALLFWAYYVIHILKKNEARKLEEKPKKDPINFKEKYEWCQVIFRGFNSNYKINQFFFLIYLVRLGFPMFIVVCAYQSPLVISIFEVIVSVLITGFIGICRPFKKKINFIQMFLFEIICLGMNICILIININDKSGGEITNRMVVIGDIFIVGNDLINFLTIIFLIIKLVIEVFNLRDVMVKYNDVPFAIRATAWLQLLAIPLQQSCMGFEEMISYSPYETYLKRTGIMGVIENQAKKTKTSDKKQAKNSLFGDLAKKPRYGISDIESEEIAKSGNNNKHDLSGASFSDMHESNIVLKKHTKGTLGSINEIGEGEIPIGKRKILNRKHRPTRFSHDPSKYASWNSSSVKDVNETGLGSPGSPGSPSSPITSLNGKDRRVLIQKGEATKGLSQETFKYF